MLFLQVSDIHFKAPQCASEDDPTRPYRTRMLQDLQRRCADLGRVDAILVGGDIAYRADPIEYQAATAWLHELAQTCNCPLERVYVVPGNHDIDRDYIRRERTTSNAQRQIQQVDLGRRSRELMEQLSDDAAGHALFAPLAAYNEFAKAFDCQVYPKRLFWKQELPLRHDVTLRLYGLTSTLLSGAISDNGKQDDSRDSLFLGEWQTSFNPADDVVNAVISHHPPDWFADHEAVEDAVRGRTALQFFGHRHRQGNLRDPQYMRFEAGAINPDRNELEWHPAYNLVDLAVEAAGKDRKLLVTARFLTWQNAKPEKYVCVQDVAGSEVWTHRIAIPEATRTVRASPEARPVVAGAPTGPQPIVPAALQDRAMNEISSRRLVTRWWRLPMNARRDIALQLGLIVDDEIALPEPERYGLALARAGERHLLAMVDQEVEKWEKQ